MTDIRANRDWREYLHSRSSLIPFCGCWIWDGPSNEGKNGRGGYGVVAKEQKNYLAHRLAYQLYKGEIPKGKLVCHTCDVRLCINPDHLFLSDAKGNTADMLRKGRDRNPGAPGDRNATRKYPGLVKGERNGRAVLTRELVDEIRAAFARGIQQREIAAQYSIGQTQVSRICRGEQWK